MKTNQIRVVVPVFLVIAAILSFFLVVDEAVEQEQVTALPVRVAKISSQPAKQVVQLAGTTQAMESALLRFQVSGRVIQKMVKVGTTGVHGVKMVMQVGAINFIKRRC